MELSRKMIHVIIFVSQNQNTSINNLVMFYVYSIKISKFSQSSAGIPESVALIYKICAVIGRRVNSGPKSIGHLGTAPLCC